MHVCVHNILLVLHKCAGIPVVAGTRVNHGMELWTKRQREQETMAAIKSTTPIIFDKIDKWRIREKCCSCCHFDLMKYAVEIDVSNMTHINSPHINLQKLQTISKYLCYAPNMADIIKQEHKGAILLLFGYRENVQNVCVEMPKHEPIHLKIKDNRF